MTANLLEGAGLALMVVFAFLVWPPAAVGVAGLLLVVAANVWASRGRAGK